ncbi:hypothetical protein EMQ25_05850 [Arsenicitalea aurantiaca]|uniref:Phosphodiester glycosidase domain-containing protein n=1 Tax=Arsenicitalea aurantiaca TaxID=1783274 RepID=A0A433XGH3_9HYPH|nr:hypothetical protein EMQ25_05850 [Arsenicitalea aurantiaca]
MSRFLASKWWLAAGALAVGLLAAFFAVAAGPTQARHCSEERFEAAAYMVCTIDPGRDDLRLFWRDAEGKPYRSFSNLARSIESDGLDLVLAMNAGMYTTDFAPLGLHVEAGETLRRIDTRTIDGPARQVPNFYKRPNGVFFVGNGTAGILTTDTYIDEAPPADFATQSGPMLVIDGALHPALIPGSSDRTRRSGVGVCADGMVRLAISNGNVNFHDFAQLFRLGLDCPNALFLDGGRGTGLYMPELRRNDRSWHGGFGPMLGLVEEKAGSSAAN